MLQGVIKEEGRFGWYLGVAFGDWLIDGTFEFNEIQSLFIIRGPCMHAPVWVQMKVLLRKGHLGWFWVELDCLVPLRPHDL
jgi:hypothetical protein